MRDFLFCKVFVEAKKMKNRLRIIFMSESRLLVFTFLKNKKCFYKQTLNKF